MDEPVVSPSEPPAAPPSGPPTEALPLASSELPPPPPEERRRPVAPLLTRAIELVLEAILVPCTLGFGWVGWWIVSWADGQSPAKVVLHIHVVNSEDGRLASFGRMAVREAVGKGVAGAALLAGAYLGVLWLPVAAGVYLVAGTVVALTDVRRRTLWDRLARTVVVEGDPPPLAPAPTMPAAPTAPVEASTALT
jgi:uncharacterized RDD family membrane protein YckC